VNSMVLSFLVTVRTTGVQLLRNSQGVRVAERGLAAWLNLLYI